MQRNTRRLVGIAVTAAACLGIGLATWLVHGYLYDASFMEPADGSSGTIANICTVGEPLYFGYPLAPTHSLHITGAELVGVPDTFTVEGIYAVNSDNGKYTVLGGGTQANWEQMGYSTAHLYPVTAVNLADGKWDGWWLVAKVVPHVTGKQMIQGIRISYESGWRSGSTSYAEQAVSNCQK